MAVKTAEKKEMIWVDKKVVKTVVMMAADLDSHLAEVKASVRDC
jgi:hypothetical protein